MHTRPSPTRRSGRELRGRLARAERLAGEISAAAISFAVTFSGWWHAARWPFAYAISGGSTVLQTSVARGQRGWKTQPDGGLIGFGGSPDTT